MKLSFYSGCVGWPSSQIDQLHKLIDNRKDITKETFLKHADVYEFMEEGLERQKLRDILNDRYTNFYKYKGIYWFEWSRIEHVYANPEQIENLLD